MAQVTIDLDEETAEQMRHAARSEGVSQSRWLAALVRERVAKRWPADIAILAGTWADAPLAEDAGGRDGADVPREPL